MPTNKERILLALEQLHQAEDSNDLTVLVGNGVGKHAITHLLWRLQKQGLITFATHKSGGRAEYPVNIRLTTAGVRTVKDLHHGR